MAKFHCWTYFWVHWVSGIQVHKIEFVTLLKLKWYGDPACVLSWEAFHSPANSHISFEGKGLWWCDLKSNKFKQRKIKQQQKTSQLKFSSVDLSLLLQSEYTNFSGIPTNSANKNQCSTRKLSQPTSAQTRESAVQEQLTYSDIPIVSSCEDIMGLIQQPERGLFIRNWLPDLHPDWNSWNWCIVGDKQVPLHQATWTIYNHLQQAKTISARSLQENNRFCWSRKAQHKNLGQEAQIYIWDLHFAVK